MSTALLGSREPTITVAHVRSGTVAGLRAIVTRELLRGSDETQCVSELSSRGIATARVEACMRDVLADPYFAIGRAATTEALIGKRILHLHGEMWLSKLAGRSIPEFHTPVDDLFREYFAENVAFVLRNGAGEWKAVKTWTPESMCGRFPDATVEYMRGTERYSTPQPRRRTTLKKFGEWLQAKPYSNEYYITATNVKPAALGALRADIGRSPFQAVELDLNDDSMMRLWLGPGGTITPLHFDLMPNVFVQIYGIKKMLLAPPSILDWVGAEKGVFAPFDPIAPDLFENPRASRIRYWQVELKPGDVLYIPMGWWHWVYAKSTSISLNFFNVALSGSRLGWHEVPPKTSSNEFANVVTSLIEGEPLNHTAGAAGAAPNLNEVESHPVVRMLQPLAHRRRFIRNVLEMYRNLWLELGWKAQIRVLPRWELEQAQESYARSVPFIAQQFGVPQSKRRRVKNTANSRIASMEHFGVSFLTDHLENDWSQIMKPRVVVATKRVKLALVPPFFIEPPPCQKNRESAHQELHLHRCPFCKRFATVSLLKGDALFVPAAWWLRATNVPRITVLQTDDLKIFDLNVETRSTT